MLHLSSCLGCSICGYFPVLTIAWLASLGIVTVCVRIRSVGSLSDPKSATIKQFFASVLILVTDDDQSISLEQSDV
jgi:hypothetical protein